MAAAASPPAVVQSEEDAPNEFETCWQGRGDDWADKARCRLLVYNVAKKHNIGSITRTATALGLEGLMVVGSRRNLRFFGQQGTARFMPIQEYASLAECKAELVRKDYRLVGVEIDARAKDVTTHPFSGNTVFVLGNEGTGIDPQLLELCDDLVYIPQYFPGTASLNVAIAGSIVLHHFALWAKYPQCRLEGQKFEVDDQQAVKMHTATPEIRESIMRSRVRRQEFQIAVQYSQAAASEGWGPLRGRWQQRMQFRRGR